MSNRTHLALIVNACPVAKDILVLNTFAFLLF